MARKNADARTGTDDGRAELLSVITRGESVYALVLMSGASVADARGRDLDAAPPARVVDAVEREIDRLREAAPDLADGPLAASLVSMALELENPYTSATAKSYCQARLADGLRELRALAPPKESHDAIDGITDELAARREHAQRLAGAKATAGS